MATVIIFILILSLLVIVHEAGHFVMAKKFGMKVYEFGIGFPPRALGFYKNKKTGKWVKVSGKGKNSLKETVGGDERVEEYPNTLWSFNWLPLGGFVKIKGESGEDAKDEDSFAHKKPWQRIVVLVAGVVMNFILAAVLLSVGFMIGLPTDVTDGIPEGVTIVEPKAVVIQQVMPDSAGDVAGLEPGDKVLQINNNLIGSSAEMVEVIKEVGTTEITLHIKRGTEKLNLTAAPFAIEGEGEDPRLGVLLADAAVIRYPWYRAIFQGFVSAFFALIGIFVSFFILIKQLILGNGLAFEVSGPVGIASVVGQSAKLGINYLINVTAMISLSLAVINILPIPALDGGRALFVIIEKIIRRPVPMKYEQTAHTIGFLLLMLLVIVVTVRDVLGLVG